MRLATLGTGGLAAAGSQSFAGMIVITVIRSSNTDKPFLAICVGIVLFRSSISF